MNDLVKCPKCKSRWNLFDFFGKEWCFKCIYKEKCKELAKYEKIRFCKICKVQLPTFKWRYCGKVCAAIAKKAYKHWTEEIKSQNVVFLKLASNDNYAIRR